jgi:hypothetical protein
MLTLGAGRQAALAPLIESFENTRPFTDDKSDPFDQFTEQAATAQRNRARMRLLNLQEQAQIVAQGGMVIELLRDQMEGL